MRTYVRAGQSPPYPQHQIGEIVDRALAEGDAERALQWARELKQVSLDRALALTIALGRADDVRYVPAAHRFLSASSSRPGHLC